VLETYRDEVRQISNEFTEAMNELDFQQNPARFIGREIPNYLPLPAANAAEQASAAANAGRRVIQLNGEAPALWQNAKEIYFFLTRDGRP
jgi:hypothetical protein